MARRFVCIFLFVSVLKKILASNEPVTLALDGWTNVNHHKVTNLILLNQGRAYFWNSVQNDSRHNTAGISPHHSYSLYIVVYFAFA